LSVARDAILFPMPESKVVNFVKDYSRKESGNDRARPGRDPRTSLDASEERKANRAEVLRSAAERAPTACSRNGRGRHGRRSGEEISHEEREDRAAGSSGVTASRSPSSELFELDNAQMENSACSSNISSPSPWSRASAPFSHPPPAARAPDPRGNAATGSGPKSDPRHASDRGVLGATVRIVFITRVRRSAGEALRPRNRPGKPGSAPAADPSSYSRSADDGRRRQGHHG